MNNTVLQIQHLYKNFGAIRATSDVSFSIEKGDIHALIGPNGAGKTTLVNQLSGDILPDKGTILFNSSDITTLKAHKRAQLGISRSFQITHVFEQLTVAENMALAIHSKNGHNFRFWKRALGTSQIQKEVSIALERVDLARQSKQPARVLSHGQKRQLEVGMALVGNPELLIMDEPMAGMGTGGTQELAKLIEGLRGSVTILLVEHDMDIVFSIADTVTVLVYGEHIATGTPSEIRANPKVRSAYLGEEDEC
ncbi:ABC transporter ATP-binding protein [Desulforhopalus sp. 52FAK]